MTAAINTPEAFGAALRAARQARGLRLEDVALGAGVGIRFVSELERGKATARLGSALLVAQALGVNLVLVDPDAPDT